MGSNRGLITDLNDGSGTVQFFCFTDTPAVYAPDSLSACTYVYPIGYGLMTSNVNNQKLQVDVSPVPAYDILHVTSSGTSELQVVVYNCIGQQVWSGGLLHKLDISVSSWVKGIYYMQCKTSGSEMITKKILVE